MSVVIANYATNLSAVPEGTGVGDDAFTPPSAEAGDFLLWIGIGRGSTASPPASGTGGQTWTEQFNLNANPRQLNVNWAQFDGTWVGNLAGANSVSPGTNFVLVLRDNLFSGVTWVIETLSGASNQGSSTTHTIVGGNTSGDNALAVGVTTTSSVQNYAYSAGSFTLWLSSDGFRNTSGSDNCLCIVEQYLASAGATGNATLTVGASVPSTRGSVAVRASGGSPRSGGGGVYYRRRRSTTTGGRGL